MKEDIRLDKQFTKAFKYLEDKYYFCREYDKKLLKIKKAYEELADDKFKELSTNDKNYKKIFANIILHAKDLEKQFGIGYVEKSLEVQKMLDNLIYFLDSKLYAFEQQYKKSQEINDSIINERLKEINKNLEELTEYNKEYLKF